VIATFDGQVITEPPDRGNAVRRRICIDVESVEVFAQLGRADACGKEEAVVGKSGYRYEYTQCSGDKYRLKVSIEFS
jgi:hypothetical protein